MKEVMKRIWNEPAAFIGLLTSLILVALNVIGDNEWDFDNIVAVAAPFISALGIRQAVYSPATVDQLTAPPPKPVVAVATEGPSETTTGFEEKT